MADPRRRFFSGKERQIIFAKANGRCEHCAIQLSRDWQADHVIPFALGGPTDVRNGQALCPDCNREKGASMENWPFEFGPRVHQVESLETAKRNWSEGKRRIVLRHCVGSGKTVTVWMIDNWLRSQQHVTRTVYYAPRLSLIGAAYEAFDQPGLGCSLSDTNGNKTPLIQPGKQGFVSTLSALVMNPDLHLSELGYEPFHLILDEAQFAGLQNRGGREIGRLVERAAFTTIVTATFQRSDNTRIAGIDYQPVIAEDGSEVSMPVLDKPQLGYKEGVAVNIVRRCEFYWADAKVDWSDGKQGQISGQRDRLGSLLRSRAVWEPIVDKFIQQYLDAYAIDGAEKGIVFAADISHAKDVCAYIGSKGLSVAVATSDDSGEVDAKGARVLADFARNDDRTQVVVTVGMAGVGYNQPRIGVVCNINPIRTMEMLIQMFGRGLRINYKSHIKPEKQFARLVIPMDPAMKRFKEWMESESAAGVVQRDACDVCGQIPCACPCATCGARRCICVCDVCENPVRTCTCRERVNVVGVSEWSAAVSAFGGASLSGDDLAAIERLASRHSIHGSPLQLKQMLDEYSGGARVAVVDAPKRDTSRAAKTELHKAINSEMWRIAGRFCDYESVKAVANRATTALCMEHTSGVKGRLVDLTFDEAEGLLDAMRSDPQRFADVLGGVS